jgi:hypothetical protein
VGRCATNSSSCSSCGRTIGSRAAAATRRQQQQRYQQQQWQWQRQHRSGSSSGSRSGSSRSSSSRRRQRQQGQQHTWHCQQARSLWCCPCSGTACRGARDVTRRPDHQSCLAAPCSVQPHWPRCQLPPPTCCCHEALQAGRSRTDRMGRYEHHRGPHHDAADDFKEPADGRPDECLGAGARSKVDGHAHHHALQPQRGALMWWEAWHVSIPTTK